MLGGALLAVVIVVAFGKSVRFDFVYDDRWTIVENRFLDAPLAKLLSAVAAGTAQAQGLPDATRPSMIASLWLDRRLFGHSPALHHLHSLLLYVAAAAAAALAAFAIARNEVVALLAGLFFALSPVHAEVAAAVNYREDLIAGIGVLVPLGWLFWPRFEGSTVSAVAVGSVWLWGLLGKESALVLLPLVFALAVVLRVGRDFWRSRELSLFVLASVAIVWLSWRLALMLVDDGIPRAAGTRLSESVYDTCRFMARSVWVALFPSVSAPEYGTLAAASAAWLLAPLAIVIAIAFLGRRVETRTIAAGICVAAIASFVASPLAGRPINPWADRYVFVAVFGGGLVWGTLGAQLARVLPLGARLPTLLVSCAVAAFACSRSANVWATERTLWTAGVKSAPGSPRAWAALSRVERLDGNLAAADRDVARALEIDPHYTPARVTLTYNMLAHGDVEGARREIDRLERLGEGDQPALGRARACAVGNAEEASRCIRGGR
jgi:hypothetical protein